MLSVTGGIPRYLEEINPSLSAEENIRRLCFAPRSLRAAKSARGKPGVQVDLLLQTRRSVWLVEVKRKKEIGREIETEVERKVDALTRPEKPGRTTHVI